MSTLESRDPKEYFETRIKSLQEKINISHDLAILLLNKFKWDEQLIIKEMTNSPKEFLQQVGIDLGSDSFPTIESPISAKNCGTGECPICCEEISLIQLYCGNKLCEDCFIEEIQSQLKANVLPTIRVRPDYLPILPSDVEKYVKDQNMLDKYYKLLVYSFTLNCNDIRLCHECNLILTEKDDIGFHTAQCPKCHLTYCLKCGANNSHIPLSDCSKINEFHNIKNEFDQLIVQQELWLKREERLVSYRKDHLDEVTKYYDQLIAEIETKINKDEFDQRKKSEILSILNDIKQSFVLSITEVGKHQYYKTKFNSDLENLATLFNHEMIADEYDVFKRIIKCPKCNAPIIRDEGCILVRCPHCHYDFCSICLQPWYPGHENKYICPNIKTRDSFLQSHVINGVNYDDENDKKFYPMPFNFDDQIRYAKWNYCKSQFDKYHMKQNLYEESINACRANLIKIFGDKSDLPSKYVNDVLFAFSVLAYSYPFIFYSNNANSRSIEDEISKANENIDEITSKFKDTNFENPENYFQNKIEALNNIISGILHLARQ